MSNVTVAPAFSIFVTTYGIANQEGFATGKWFDLSDYADKLDFISAARDYAQNVLGDNKPELCFSDCSKSIKALIDENFIPSSLWKVIELDEYQQEIFFAYSIAVGDICDGVDDMLERFDSAYLGEFDSIEDFAEHQATESGKLDQIEAICPILAAAINWTHVAASEMINISSHNNHYFSRL